MIHLPPAPPTNVKLVKVYEEEKQDNINIEIGVIHKVQHKVDIQSSAITFGEIN